MKERGSATLVGNRIDLDHEIAQEYLREKTAARLERERTGKPKPGRKPKSKPKGRPGRKPKPKSKPDQPSSPSPGTSWSDSGSLLEIPNDIEELADLTLRQLIDKFGTDVRFHDWLKAIKEIEMVNEKRIKNAQNQGRLVSRQLVETGVIDVINAAHLRLMVDGAKTITAAVLSKHQAGISEQDIEAYVSDTVGSFIRPIKAKVQRNLKRVAIH